MHKSDVFIIIALAYLGGIICASFFIGHIDMFRMIYLFPLFIGVAGVYWHHKTVVVICFALITFFFGGFNYLKAISPIAEIKVLGENGQIIKGEGVVIREYTGVEDKRIVINILEESKGRLVSVKGLIYLDRYNQVSVGDKVDISGLAKYPENFADFDYVSYLAKEDIFFIIRKPSISVIGKGEYDIVMEKMAWLKKYISNSMSADFIPSHAPVVQAMVLGESEKMSKEYKEKLMKTGLSHAIAISGSHFALISVFLFAFFMSIGLWKKQVYFLVMISILLYIVLISFPASAVRAGIMIGVVCISRIVERQTQDWRLLVLAAFLMALQNPLVINHDLGFQLSFLAVLGLLYLTPIVGNWVKSLIGDKIAWIRNIISATLAAQIAVAPFLLVATHGLSFSGLIANILIVPVMPICLGLGFIYPFFSIIPFAGKVIAILSFPLIAYLNGVIDFFASLPFSYLNIQIPGFYAFSIYLVIITFLVRYKKEGSICIGEIK